MTKHSRSFIFDLDGTLVDSLQDLTDALNSALTALARPLVSGDQVRAWVGDGLPILCRRALPGEEEGVVLELARRTKVYYLGHCADRTRTYPNILPMLKLLQARGGRMAVLSNKPHELTIAVVEQLALGEYFDEVRGCRREAERKPSPRVALEIAQRLDTEPHAVFFVGDSPVDVTTARNAGMIAVAVAWGFRSRNELLEARPDYFIEGPLELPDLAERLAGG